MLRLLTTGLCVACVVLLATSPPHIEPAAPPVTGERPAPAVLPLSVVDVAGGVAPSGLTQLAGLRADEEISAINDRPLTEDVLAYEAIAALAPGPGDYVDLTVSGANTERRVLLLIH